MEKKVEYSESLIKTAADDCKKVGLATILSVVFAAVCFLLPIFNTEYENYEKLKTICVFMGGVFSILSVVLGAVTFAIGSTYREMKAGKEILDDEFII